MKKGSVLVSDLSGRGKRIYHRGDVVSENDFSEGKFEKLVKGKFIEEVIEPVVPSKVLEKEVIEPKKFITKILTKRDIRDNEDLREKGYKPGDTIEIPNPEYKEEEGE